MAEAVYELHVRRDARHRYQIETPLFAHSGSAGPTDLYAARLLAQRMNKARDLASNPAAAIHAADINAVGLIDEIGHAVVQSYCEENGVNFFSNLRARLQNQFGADGVTSCLSAFTERFPPAPVYQGNIAVSDYLGAASGEEMALKEMLFVSLENTNPALDRFAELFNDSDLGQETEYSAILAAAASFFTEQPPIGPHDQPLVEMLATPARLFPNSLEDQLRYMQSHWAGLLGAYLIRILRSLDFLQEEAKQSGFGPGPARLYSYEGGDPERFSPDRDWMPNVVLLAKSTLVWLDQLARRYQRGISRLDSIPDEELDRLAAWGINALWLIGIWERSRASRRIKHILGNPEAEASAYALLEYEIAEELGGWSALENLRDRCAKRGIRLASDMVPNHTGIDGRWVMDHPDWYVQVQSPPFPSYTFDSDNLSSDPDVGIHLEDHYYSRSDASVVFRRTDHKTGETRFIYHGNDGTTMPWNDTAQLDFLNPQVRDAIVQTILHVARSFPIIRFDAAMTLTRKHFQRLWFPEPGSGGDIPSRAEHGLTRAEFDAAMPEEFWRQVVDRVAEERPDTLLLAEAFWMMEGYFVRTLGMHRVYNSAFMNMLKDEENAKYRQTIKTTIEFDKDILKRFVNFMNNPDEETAVAQFGTGDKYFGVCTMMATMPGLPMIGHGQIEGFEEKYGMEYRKAYRQEMPNEGLVDRHEQEIFPLLRRRYLFSSVENFLLFDLHPQHGAVNENVFIYSNRVGGERSLVIYNNAYEPASGWFRTSARFIEKEEGGAKVHREETIASAVGVRPDQGYYCIFRDHRSGRWFIRRSSELHEKGLFVSLAGFQCHVFLDFAEVHDTSGHYGSLADELQGVGVVSVEAALREIALRPLLDLFGSVVNDRTLEMLAKGLKGGGPLPGDFQQLLRAEYQSFLAAGTEYRLPNSPIDLAADQMERRLVGATSIPQLKPASDDTEACEQAIAFYRNGIDRIDRVALLCGWLFVSPLSRIYSSAAAMSDEWALYEPVLRSIGSDHADPAHSLLFRLLLSGGEDWLSMGSDAEPAAGVPIARHPAGRAAATVNRLVSDADAIEYLGFNEYDGVVWFSPQRFDELIWWLFVLAAIDAAVRLEGDVLIGEIIAAHRTALILQRVAAESESRVKNLLEGLGIKRDDA